MKKTLAILFFLAFGLAAQAQVKRELALEAMKEGRYEDAREDWEDLYRSKPDDFHYNQLLECHIALKDWDEARDLIDDYSDRAGQRGGFFQIDLGHIHKLEGDSTQAGEVFEKALSDVGRQPQYAHMYSERFKKWGLFAEALRAYEIAEVKSGNLMAYAYQKALLYAELGQLKAMYGAFLDAIQQNPGYRSHFQNLLRYSMDREGNLPHSEDLKMQLIERIQNSGKREYSELLIWVLAQEGNFGQAFIQARALYRRGELQAFALLNLAAQAEAARDYRSAIRVYDFVVDEGDRTPYHKDAIFGREKVHILELEHSDAEQDAYREHVPHLRNAINELRGHSSRGELFLQLAEIQYLRLRSQDSALATLDILLKNVSTASTDICKAKLLKGDILLAQNLPYDALLLYAQVEKEFEASPLGQEARYRKARVAFYTGHFEWAKSQFDVLKTSTSKLISNDALRMSLLIKDNAGLDTSYFHLEQYATVLLLQAQRRFDEALVGLDSLQANVKYHPLADEVIYLRAEIHEEQGHWIEASEGYLKVADEHGRDLLADEALFRAALLFEEKLNQPAKARELYERLLAEHSNSIFVEDARQRYRTLRGDLNI